MVPLQNYTHNPSNEVETPIDVALRVPTTTAAGVSLYVLFHVVFGWCLTRVRNRWPSFASYLLLTLEERKKDIGGTVPMPLESEQKEWTFSETVGCIAFLFFVTNLLFCILWYIFKYDPTGTVNPGWTEVFG